MSGERRAFTLIELLVVISIIALMMAILLPALTKARDTARKIQCASGVKQIVLAEMAYAEDNDGWFQDGVAWGEANVWFADYKRSGTIRSYLGMNKHLNKHWEYQGAAPGPLTVLLCPNRDEGLDRGYTHLDGKGTGTTYMIALGSGNRGSGSGNWHGWSSNSTGSNSNLRPLPRQEMQSPDYVSPSAQPAIGELWRRDGGPWSGWAYWHWRTKPTLNVNHADGANVGFADGHVQFRNSDDFTKRIHFYSSVYSLWW